MKIIETTILDDKVGETKKIISLISDNSNRRFNITEDEIQSNAQENKSTPNYQFPIMVDEERARELYIKLTTN